MYIIHSTFIVPPHKADEVIGIYQSRSGNVDQAEGFVKFLLLLNEAKAGELTVHMEWESKEAYLAWVTSEEYKQIQALERQYPDPELAGIVPRIGRFMVVAT
ncbi:heme-degrading monooxygenase HmoA [Paenibacillus phyllosphaerae]|uniref:Heme-degrading monooxygenase HmoA n=1 Tax=Paenibacillus phyllosphaerae TaxID=274593 RepID=A0A7W5B3R8_9BACL|nr:antibiotic biosynthesis monooxygenase family protein [Paenibacillus phyllosphaerae]MBB3113885.1 heme-degrading monooxygenase HmoA [Paenibacillus phyllosphaerae]